MDYKDLKESGQLSVIDASPVPFALNDDDGHIVYLNPEFTKTFGYQLEEISILEDWWPKAYPDPEYRRWVLEEWGRRLEKTLGSDEDFEPMEIEVRCKSGDVKSVIAYARTLDEHYSGLHLVVLFDITKQKSIQNQLQEVNVNLEEKVRERTRELERAKQKLEYLASTDGLTNLANRRHFDDFLEFEWLRHIREKEPLSLLIIDVDYFKKYNDSYGHLAGDDCLIDIARILLDITKRSSDLSARYGGEEFACVLPNTDSEGAVQVARNIQAEISKLKIPHESSPIDDYVTVSIGINTCIPSQQYYLFGYIDGADQCLYQAKEKGRNIIVAVDADKDE